MKHKSNVYSCARPRTAVLLLAITICATAVLGQSNLSPSEQKIERLRQQLSSTDEEQRRDAVMQLGAMRLPSASRAALPALADNAPMVRAVAAQAILSIDPDEAVEALTHLMSDKNEFVRREATYALGQTHSKRATAIVSTILQSDKNEGVRAAAVVALGELRDETAVPLLVSVLAPRLTQPGKGKISQDQNPFVLRAAATALGLIGSRAATPALVFALTNEKYSDDVKREAAISLGLIGDPAATSALRTAANSADPYLASLAEQSLRKLSP